MLLLLQFRPRRKAVAVGLRGVKGGFLCHYLKYDEETRWKSASLRSNAHRPGFEPWVIALHCARHCNGGSYEKVLSMNILHISHKKWFPGGTVGISAVWLGVFLFLWRVFVIFFCMSWKRLFGSILISGRRTVWLHHAGKESSWDWVWEAEIVHLLRVLEKCSVQFGSWHSWARLMVALCEIENLERLLDGFYCCSKERKLGGKFGNSKRIW